MLNWIKNSGLVIALTLNPFHWRLKPYAVKEVDEWVGPKENRWSIGWLMISLRVWSDDGSW